MTSPVSAADVPSSERSAAAAKRIEPKLKERLSESGLTLGAPIFIRIFKDPGTLEVWMRKGDRFQLFKSYDICTFSGKPGPKLKEGDKQAPEGCYFVTPKRMNPRSRFHLSFDLGYPNEYDRLHGRTGSALMVHGDCVSIGCYAMGDANIEEIWTLCSRALGNGQPFFRVHCFPFPLTREKLRENVESDWIGFWRELRAVYDYFEAHKTPPDVVVRDKKYAIAKEMNRTEAIPR